MENKKNMCVLFAAFNFDRRFVFDRLEAHVPDSGEKSDKKSEVKTKPDSRKALGELKGSIEAREKAPGKPYSITKLEAVRHALDKAVVRLRGTTIDRRLREYPPVLGPIGARIRAAGEALKLNPDDYVSPKPFVYGNMASEILIRCANVVEDVSDGETGEGERTIEAVAEVTETTLPLVMIWINPTTRQEQAIVIALIDRSKAEEQKNIEKATSMSPRQDWKRRALQAQVEDSKKDLVELEARKAEVQAMKLPQ